MIHLPVGAIATIGGLSFFMGYCWARMGDTKRRRASANGTPGT